MTKKRIKEVSSERVNLEVLEKNDTTTVSGFSNSNIDAAATVATGPTAATAPNIPGSKNRRKKLRKIFTHLSERASTESKEFLGKIVFDKQGDYMDKALVKCSLEVSDVDIDNTDLFQAQEPKLLKALRKLVLAISKTTGSNINSEEKKEKSSSARVAAAKENIVNDGTNDAPPAAKRRKKMVETNDMIVSKDTTSSIDAKSSIKSEDVLPVSTIKTQETNSVNTPSLQLTKENLEKLDDELVPDKQQADTTYGTKRQFLKPDTKINARIRIVTAKKPQKVCGFFMCH